MKCPECSEDLKYHCYIKIENLWVHYIILCSNLPGGVTEENLLSYTQPTNIEFYREVKARREAMALYYKPQEG